MVDMVVADENIDIRIRFETLRRQLEGWVKLALFPAPVIENKQGFIARNGKSAVIVMCYLKGNVHNPAHLRSYCLMIR